MHCLEFGVILAELFTVLFRKIQYLLPAVLHIFLVQLNIVLERLRSLARIAVNEVGQMDTVKIQRLQDLVYLLDIGSGSKAEAVAVFLVPSVCQEVEVFVVIVWQLVVAVHGKPSETHLDVLAGEYLLEVDIHRAYPLAAAQVHYLLQRHGVGAVLLFRLFLFRTQLLQVVAHCVDFVPYLIRIAVMDIGAVSLMWLNARYAEYLRHHFQR